MVRMVGQSEAAEDIIRDSNKGELNKLAADIFRVLVVDHGVCWRSELERDLLKILLFSGQPSPPNEKIDEALKILKDSGLIDIEDRKRGDWPRMDVYMDQFLKLKDLAKARRALEHDQLFLSYSLARQRKIHDALG